jgi:two-component system, OmpR family, copper resistance phosphate regulon response regulator CusR
MRILVIEDDPKTAKILKSGLSEEGFVVDVSDNGENGLHLANSAIYSLVVLDVMLPGLDGWQILRSLREAENNVRILMVTARDSVDHKIKGLTLGADDYLVKPFSFAELVARVRALLRRDTMIASEVQRFDDLVVEPRRHVASRAGTPLVLSAKEISLLSLLLAHQGEVLTRTFIIEKIWDMMFDCDSNVVDVNVRRLRAKVDDPFPRKILHTVRGRGYVIR